MKWLWRFAALLGILQILVTATPVLRYWTSALSAPWGPDDGETLIVLGSDRTDPGFIGISSYWRSVYAVLIWRAGHFQKMVISGKVAAGPMRDFVVAQGIPRESITLEENSVSTRENALFVARLLHGDSGRKVLLTSDFHSRRALAAFRKAGISATALPYPDANKRIGDWTQRWTIFCVLASETVKTAWYKAHGWT